MQDEKILDLFWARDEDAIHQTRQKYENYCRSIAMRILANAECSAECLNDTWLNAWNAIPPQRPSVLRIFLGTITRNLALNRVRSLASKKRGGGHAILALDEISACIPDSDLPENALEEREITDSINRWLSALPQEKRVVFIRRYWHCDSLSDIAARMGWSEGKTNSLLHRLRGSLKNYLKQEGFL